MTISEKKARDPVVDIAKGIVIIMMVGGHSWLPFWCDAQFVGLFHMSFFMMLSGYCMRERHMENCCAFGKFIVSRIRTLYVPYVVANGGFILCNNLFLKLQIFCASGELADRIQVGIGPDTYLSFAEIMKQLLLAILFLGYSPRLGGATWFLRALFVISIVYAALGVLLHKQRKRAQIQAGIGILLLLMWAMDQLHPFIVISSISQICLYYWAYAVGYLLHCLKDKNGFLPEDSQMKRAEGKCRGIDRSGSRHRVIVIFTMYLLLQLLSKYGEYIYSKLTEHVAGAFGIVCMLLFLAAKRFLAGMAGWFMVIGTAAVIEQFLHRAGTALTACGRRTLAILLLHFLCFKSVTLIYVLLKNLPMYYLGATPILPNVSWIWGILYIMAGVIIPMLLWECGCNLIISVKDFLGKHSQKIGD